MDPLTLQASVNRPRMKRMAKRVCSGSGLQQASECIGYAVQHVKTEEEVETLFAVLHGTQPLESAVSVLPSERVLKNLHKGASNNTWTTAKPWCDWWQRPRHLGEYSRSSVIMFCEKSILCQ